MAKVTMTQREALDQLSAADFAWREGQKLAYARARRVAEIEVAALAEERRRLAVQAVQVGNSKRRVYMDGLHTSDSKSLEKLLTWEADEKPPVDLEAPAEAPHMGEVEKTPEPVEPLKLHRKFDWVEDGLIQIDYPNFPSELGWQDYPDTLKAIVTQSGEPSGFTVVDDQNMTPDPREQFADDPAYRVPGPIQYELDAAPRPNGLREQLNAWIEAQR